MLNKSTVKLMALGLVGSFVATAVAQDSGALIDALVRKGVLKDQEAEDIRAQLTRDFAANSSAGKLNLNSSVKELKLSGDIRVRGQYDDRDTQTTGNSSNVDQRTRYRLRLRVNADYKVSDNFFAGFGLQTEQKSDSGNQTMAGNNGAATAGSSAGDYFQNYSIYINKAFLGWNPINGVTLIGGKQPNPFYTTDMVWDADINPTGFTERVDLHKVFGFSGVELSLVAGQLIVADTDNEKLATGKTNRDAWVYQTQLIASAEVVEGFKLTIAPGFYCTNAASLSLASADGGGEFNSVKWASAANLNQLDGLKVILLPGDVSFKVAGKPAKVLWDVAYNKDGTDRTALYGAPGTLIGTNGKIAHSGTDDLAFLVGFQVGENKKKGDWSLLANYRQVGLAAVDPNINDSDWALSYTNMAGFKVGFTYNLGDSTTLGITAYTADNLRKNLSNDGSYQPAYGPGSGHNSVNVIQLDAVVKF